MARFQPGQSGNPSGRPKHQQRYLKSLVRLVKRDDWQGIVLKAIEQARRGDKSARQFLADYCLGKPAQQIDIGDDNKVTIEVVHVNDADIPTETT